MVDHPRKDPLEFDYGKIEIFNIIITVLFWTIATLSILLLYNETINQPLGFNTYNVLKIAFIILVIIHFIIDLFNRLYLIPRTERKRRLLLLSDSFGVPLLTEKASLYYNNQHIPSLFRLGLNIFENTHFTKRICQEMAVKTRLKVLFYIIIWLVCALNRSNNIEIVAIFAQVLFSGHILVNFFHLELYRSRNEKLFDNLYNFYLEQKRAENSLAMAKICEFFAEYEVAKASCSIKQSSKIFRKLNNTLSQDWAEIKKDLQVD